MTSEANWEVLTFCPPRQSLHQQPVTRWWSHWKSSDTPTPLSLTSCVAHIIVSSSTTCWRGFLSYIMFLILTTNVQSFFHPSRCIWPRLRDIIRSYLSLSDLSPPNPYMMYLHVLLAFPTRSCEDHIISTTHSPFFTISRSFICHWICWPRTCSQKFQFLTYRLIVNFKLWYQLLKPTIALWLTVVHAQDRVQQCRTVTICSTCKRELL